MEQNREQSRSDQPRDARSTRSKTTINLSNPSTTEINLTIRCENQSQVQSYAKWIKQQVEGLTAVTHDLGNQEITVDYDQNFRGLRAA